MRLERCWLLGWASTHRLAGLRLRLSDRMTHGMRPDRLGNLQGVDKLGGRWQIGLVESGLPELAKRHKLLYVDGGRYLSVAFGSVESSADDGENGEDESEAFSGELDERLQSLQGDGVEASELEVRL